MSMYVIEHYVTNHFSNAFRSRSHANIHVTIINPIPIIYLPWPSHAFNKQLFSSLVGFQVQILAASSSEVLDSQIL